MPSRILVVSHPSVVEANQDVYAELSRRGHDVHLIVPHTWTHEYSDAPLSPTFRPELRSQARAVRVLGAGHPQRHVYRVRAGALLADVAPDFVLLEQEPFSLSAAQWGRAASRAGVPFALQHDENRRTSWPLPVRRVRAALLDRAAFVAARSPRAAALLIDERPALRAPVIPHPIPEWEVPPRVRDGVEQFTVGYAGRIVAEKGIRDLLAAVRRLPAARLLVVGDGPLLGEVRDSGLEVEVRTAASSDDMPQHYADMDVLVLPSRTVGHWAEQFGRVLPEAAMCGTPVIGSDSGEIPWVVAALGGRVFPEGDIEALTAALEQERDRPRDPRPGREAASAAFAVPAVATLLADEIGRAVRSRGPRHG